MIQKHCVIESLIRIGKPPILHDFERTRCMYVCDDIRIFQDEIYRIYNKYGFRSFNEMPMVVIKDTLVEI